MSVQKRLIQNDLTAKGNKGSINQAIGEEINSKAGSIKKINCNGKKG